MVPGSSSQSRWLVGTTAFIASISLSLAVQTPVQAPAAPVGKLELTVKLVKADLSVIPAPKKVFKVESAEKDQGFATSVVTGFEGTAAIDLPLGNYLLSSSQAVEFEGSRYVWSVPFEIRPNQTTKIELSNDNATVEKVARSVEGGPVPTEGTIFREVKPSVFKVIAEAGTGSGFLVDGSGLVLTNHHVVQNSDYLAVKVDSKRKYPAVVAADDPRNDLAVLLVNPAAVEGLAPLRLSAETAERPSVSVGERVLAVGSPLVTETILTSGIVSKVEEGVIYSDVSINPGNSGGPLFNMLGEVIGVNTFGLLARGGPGVAGIVRIHLARQLIESARSKVAAMTPPPAKRLPEASDYRFPPDKLKEIALGAPYNPANYHIHAGRIDVQLITPVVIASLEVQGEREAAEGRAKRTRGSGKEYKPGEDFYEWRKYAGDYRPVVTVQAIPEIAMTGGSVFAMIMLGPNAPANFKFKTDFERMELIRDGTIVEPIHPGRSPNIANEQHGNVSIKDVAYYGRYEYPPEAFRPPAKVSLKIYEQGRPEPKEREIPPEMLHKVWADFEPYFEALQKEVATPGDGKN